MKKLILGLTSLAIPASHGFVTVIDDFEQGGFLVIQNGPGSNIDVQTGIPVSSTIGGQRVTRVHNTSDPANNNGATNAFSPGQFDWSVDTQTTGHFHIYYGYNTYTGSGVATEWNGQVGTEYSDLEADFSGETGITIDVVFADVADSIRIGLITNRGELNEAVVSLEVPVASSASPQQLVFDFASFTIVEGVIGDFDITNVDQIIVEAANDLTSADWTIEQIGTVPEPSSALLGLVGLLGLARRRR